MRFIVSRKPECVDHIDGELFLYSTEEKNHVGYTLENPTKRTDKDNRPLGIPAGLYGLEARFSPHAGKFVPWVIGVPGRTAIELHGGNHVEDSLGCILVGKVFVKAGEIAERETDHLVDLIHNANGPCEIEVRDAGTETAIPEIEEEGVFEMVGNQLMRGNEVILTEAEIIELDEKAGETLTDEKLIEIGKQKVAKK